MIFVDASALVAIIAGESEASQLADRLEQDRIRLISAMSAWETIAGLCRSHSFSAQSAQTVLNRFVSEGRFEYVNIGAREYDLAVRAYSDYGKGRHPAALNMGDCFAYACAKANRAALLYIGSDFAKTDIISAL